MQKLHLCSQALPPPLTAAMQLETCMLSSSSQSPLEPLSLLCPSHLCMYTSPMSWLTCLLAHAALVCMGTPLQQALKQLCAHSLHTFDATQVIINLLLDLSSSFSSFCNLTATATTSFVTIVQPLMNLRFLEARKTVTWQWLCFAKASCRASRLTCKSCRP